MIISGLLTLEKCSSFGCVEAHNKSEAEGANNEATPSSRSYPVDCELKSLHSLTSLCVGHILKISYSSTGAESKYDSGTKHMVPARPDNCLFMITKGSHDQIFPFSSFQSCYKI